MVTLFSGVPASGKSEFCRYLARQRGYAHYDLERYPGGWPRPDFKDAWDRDRAEFVRLLNATHRHVALDWGFPPACAPIVDELVRAGTRVVWFAAETKPAREAFIARGGIPVSAFDNQMQQIQRAGLPGSMGLERIESLAASGRFKAPETIEKELASTAVSGRGDR